MKLVQIISEQEGIAVMRKRVLCPECHRIVYLDALGAIDMDGHPVMVYHHDPARSPLQPECGGSRRSVECVKARQEETK